MARYQDLYAQMAGLAPAPDIQRMRAQAQALRQTPRPQGQMISGRFAAPHWTQNLASTGSRILGSYISSEADEQQEQYMSELSQALRGTDAPEGVMAPGYEPPTMEQRLSDIADENPYAQQIMMQQALQAPAEQWKTLTPDDAAELGLDPQKTWQMSPDQQLKVVDEPDKPPTSIQEYEMAVEQGFQGSFMDYQTQKAQAGASQTNVNMPGEDPLAGFTETSITDMSERAQTAPQRQADAEMGLNLLRKRIQSGNETGKWAPIRTEVSAWLGIEPENVATAQAFDVKMGDKVMSRIQETKGSVSNREMDYFKKIAPGSDKEPFTNFVLLEIDRRAAVREQDKLNHVEEYIQQNGNLVGFDQWYMENRDPFKPFDVDELKQEYEKWKPEPTEQIPYTDKLRQEFQGGQETEQSGTVNWSDL